MTNKNFPNPPSKEVSVVVGGAMVMNCEKVGKCEGKERGRRYGGNLSFTCLHSSTNDVGLFLAKVGKCSKVKDMFDYGSVWLS